MLLIISLSTLFFATVTSKIEENRFVFWGTVLPNENISLVLDITIPRHSNASIWCGAECSTQNNVREWTSVKKWVNVDFGKQVLQRT